MDMLMQDTLATWAQPMGTTGAAKEADLLSQTLRVAAKDLGLECRHPPFSLVL